MTDAELRAFAEVMPNWEYRVIPDDLEPENRSRDIRVFIVADGTGLMLPEPDDLPGQLAFVGEVAVALGCVPKVIPVLDLESWEQNPLVAWQWCVTLTNPSDLSAVHEQRDTPSGAAIAAVLAQRSTP